MLILAINTASSLTSIALLEINDSKNAKILSENSWKSANDEAEKLMPNIDELFSETGKNYSQIQRVIVVKGPGSFTGLRVGVTVANTIAYLNKCDLKAIDTFEYWWKKLENQKMEATRIARKSALLIFAGSKGVYVNKNKKTETINLYELKDYLRDKGIKEVFGDITEDQKKEIQDIEFLDISETFGETIAKISNEFGEPKAGGHIHIIEPKYIKNPGITESKKQFSKVP